MDVNIKYITLIFQNIYQLKWIIYILIIIEKIKMDIHEKRNNNNINHGGTITNQLKHI